MTEGRPDRAAPEDDDDVPDVMGRGRGCNLCAAAEAEVTALREQLSVLGIESSNHFARAAEAEADVTALRQQYEALLTSWAELRNRHSELLRQGNPIVEQHRQEIAALREQLAQAERVYALATEQQGQAVEGYQRQLKELRIVRDELADAYNEAKREVTALNEQLEAYKAEELEERQRREDAETHWAKAEADVTALRAQLEAHDKIDDQYRVMAEERDELHAEVAALREQLAQAGTQWTEFDEWVRQEVPDSRLSSGTGPFTGRMAIGMLKRELAEANQYGENLSKVCEQHEQLEAELTQRIAQLGAEQARLKEQLEDCEFALKQWKTCSACGELLVAPGHCPSLTRKIEAGEAERAALGPYLQHSEECDSWLCATCNKAGWLHGEMGHDSVSKPCTCGLDTLLRSRVPSTP